MDFPIINIHLFWKKNFSNNLLLFQSLNPHRPLCNIFFPVFLTNMLPNIFFFLTQKISHMWLLQNPVHAEYSEKYNDRSYCCFLGFSFENTTIMDHCLHHLLAVSIAHLFFESQSPIEKWYWPKFLQRVILKIPCLLFEDDKLVDTLSLRSKRFPCCWDNLLNCLTHWSTE